MLDYHWRNHPVLDTSVSFMEHFQKAGYAVMGTGKVWHHKHEDFNIWNPPETYGAPFAFGPIPWDGKSSTEWGSIHPKNPSSFHTDCMYASLSEVPRGKDPRDQTIEYQGWGLYDKAFRFDAPDNRDLLPDELSAQWASNRLQGDFGGKAFCLCVGFHRPHAPYILPQEFYDLIPPAKNWNFLSLKKGIG